MNEAELAARARDGDVDAWEALMRLHQDIAHRAAYLVTSDIAEAEDAVQEAFVKSYYALQSFDVSRPFRPWLLRIVTNEAHSRRRSVARHMRLTLRAMEQAPVDVTPHPDTLLIEGERHDDLISALNNLPELDRLLIAYRYFLDLTPSEMAETFGKPAGTIRSRLSRALARLREQLATVEAEDLRGTPHG